MGSISPDSAGTKRSRLKVGPQWKFRVCDCVLHVCMIGLQFWSASHQRVATTSIDIYYSRYSHIGVGCLSRKNYGSPTASIPTCRGRLAVVTSTSFTCVFCFGGKQQIGDKGKTEMGHVVWANRLLSMISGCSYERAGGWFPCPGRLESVLSLAKRLDIDFTMKLTPTSSCCGTAFRRKKHGLRPNFIYFQRDSGP